MSHRMIWALALVAMCPNALSETVLVENSLVRFQFDTSGTGLTLTSITDLTTDVVIGNESGRLWQVRTAVAFGAETLVAPNNDGFTYALNTLGDDTKELEAHWPNVPVDGSNALAVDVYITLAPDSDTSEWRIDVDWASGSDYSVCTVDLPCLSVPAMGARGDSRLALSKFGGFLMVDPITTYAANGGFAEDPFGLSTGYPGGTMTMQFNAFYDVASRQILYLAADDDEMYLHRHMFGAESDRLIYIMRAVPAENYTLGNTYSMTYHALVGTFQGATSDCWYDAAARYRDWAVDRPWCARGRFETSTEVSPAFRDADFWLLFAAGPGAETDIFPHYAETGEDWMEALGTDTTVAFWYAWENGGFNQFDPESFPAQSTFAPGIAAAHASGQSIMPYVNGWIYSTIAPNYEANQVEDLMAMRYPDGSLVQAQFPGTPIVTLMCPAAPAWRDAFDARTQQLITEYDVDGNYIDYWGGDHPCYATTHGHLPGGGNATAQGKIALGQYVRDRAQALKPDFMMSMEQCQETAIGVLDFMTQNSYINYLSGELPTDLEAHHVPLFNVVYHEYINCSSYGPEPPDSLPGVSLDLFYFGIASCTHHGEMLSIQNWWAATSSLVDESTPEEIAFVAFLKNRVDLNKAAAPYIKFGRMLRPLNVTAVNTSDADARFPGASFNGVPWLYPGSKTLPHVLASVWQGGDGSMAIILCNWTESDESITFQFDPLLYGLRSETVVGISDLLCGEKAAPVQNAGVFGTTRVVPARSFEAFQIVIVDTDGDGLTDDEETWDLDPETPGVQNPFDPDDPDSTGDDGAEGPDGIPDGQNDWDGDGMSNADEFAWGYSPVDPLSFAVLPVAGLAGLVALCGLCLLGGSRLVKRRE